MGHTIRNEGREGGCHPPPLAAASRTMGLSSTGEKADPSDGMRTREGRSLPCAPPGVCVPIVRRRVVEEGGRRGEGRREGRREERRDATTLLPPSTLLLLLHHLGAARRTAFTTPMGWEGMTQHGLLSARRRRSQPRRASASYTLPSSARTAEGMSSASRIVSRHVDFASSSRIGSERRGAPHHACATTNHPSQPQKWRTERGMREGGGEGMRVCVTLPRTEQESRARTPTRMVSGPGSSHLCVCGGGSGVR